MGSGDMELVLSALFASDGEGSPRSVLTSLKNGVNEAKLWGHPLTAPDVVRLMESRGYRLRLREHDTRILPKVRELNTIYKDSFHPIDDTLFPREETRALLDCVHNGRSALLLGKAGAGKSGCIQELIQALDAEGIPYLAPALDKFRPDFSDEYGKSLGFPASPVICMHKLFRGGPAVLLLDQLDSLRWMNSAVAGALDACKQMIRETEALNRYEGGQISILFACRKFEFETDSGIQGLFAKRDDGRTDWTKVEVGALSDAMVREIVGTPYDMASGKLRQLLRTPSALYVWTRLEKRTKKPNQQSSSAAGKLVEGGHAEVPGQRSGRGPDKPLTGQANLSHARDGTAGFAS